MFYPEAIADAIQATWYDELGGGTLEISAGDVVLVKTRAHSEYRARQILSKILGTLGKHVELHVEELD